MHRKVQSEVHVMIKIRSCRNDPIYKSSFDQRDDTGAAKARGSQGARNAHSDRHVRSQHFVSKKLASLFETRGVISKESIIHYVNQGLPARKILWHNAFSRHITLFVRATLFLQ